jgi:hypothetical protein
VGDCAKACTELAWPERVRYTPSNDVVHAAPTRPAATRPSRPVRSCIWATCRNAVVIIHGIRAAFSTGSHAQNPPQPNSTYAQRAPASMPTARRHHDAFIHGRMNASHVASSSPVIARWIVDANGTTRHASPRYSIGGWYSTAGCCRIPTSPAPSMAGICKRTKGSATVLERPVSTAPRAATTATAQGCGSWECDRDRRPMTAITSMRRVHHISDPSIAPHRAASR